MHSKLESSLRRQIVETHQRLYTLGFSVANDGNTSARLPKGQFIITPAGLIKAKLRPSDLPVVNASGKKIRGNYPVSTEFQMHLAIYNARPDVEVIIHAHPPFSIACSLANISLADPVLPEVVATLGEIPTARYATTGTRELASILADIVQHHDAIILERHGAVTVGRTLEDALQKLERVEHSARIILLSRLVGSISSLPADEVRRLHQIGGMGPA